jgi:hypothetical protein
MDLTRAVKIEVSVWRTNGFSHHMSQTRLQLAQAHWLGVSALPELLRPKHTDRIGVLRNQIPLMFQRHVFSMLGVTLDSQPPCPSPNPPVRRLSDPGPDRPLSPGTPDRTGPGLAVPPMC